MAIDTVFNKFVKFADEAVNTAAGADTLARAEVKTGKLGRHTLSITAQTGDKIGFFAGLARSADVEEANNMTRDIFLSSVFKLFGGEARVPKSVWKALQKEDFYCGKPLSARRILAVRDAVCATGVLAAEKNISLPVTLLLSRIPWSTKSQI
ncbi:MAG: hypothetical protein K6F50_04935 [Kiritimatiellae bacterium]|nr:hypothetical protein [Kiritimatiellia bacterium]